MKTATRYFDRAEELKRQGMPLRSILEDLRRDGAANLDLMRVVRDTEKVPVGVAVGLIRESGLPDFDPTFTVVISEGDPWYEEFARMRSTGDGTKG